MRGSSQNCRAMPRRFRNMLLAAPILMMMSTMVSYHEAVSFAGAIGLDHGVGVRWKDGNDGYFGNASTLEEVWSDLKVLVPNRGSNGYIQPEPIIVQDFERIVLDMMMIGHKGCFRRLESQQNEKNAHGCPEDCPLDHDSDRRSPPSSCDSIDLRSLKGKYRIGTFMEGDNGRSYCILATTSILYPWGNVIVDLDASSSKNLSFDCPHPKFDAETGEQGIRLLKGTQARSWIVAGSHRMSNNNIQVTCQPHHYFSDAAHSVNNCFLAAVAAVKFYYESVVHQDYTSVQLHGMAKSSCGSIDTFFSHGSCDRSKKGEEKIDILQRIATVHPLDKGKHAVAGSDDCNLCGSTNIEGRLINGVPRNDLCDTVAKSTNGKFIQIEQKREYRQESAAEFWNNVFNEAYPRFVALASASNVKDFGDDEREVLNVSDQDCAAS